MIFRIEQVSARDFKSIELQAHVICFGEKKLEDLSRIDFAILAFDPENQISGYATCIEMDKETLYLQHGGAFPNYEKKHHVLFGYIQMIRWMKERYKRVTTRVENTNIPYLKLALKAGFLVNGTYTFNNKIYLELHNEFKEDL